MIQIINWILLYYICRNHNLKIFKWETMHFVIIERLIVIFDMRIKHIRKARTSHRGEKKRVKCTNHP